MLFAPDSYFLLKYPHDRDDGSCQIHIFLIFSSSFSSLIIDYKIHAKVPNILINPEFFFSPITMIQYKPLIIE